MCDVRADPVTTALVRWTWWQWIEGIVTLGARGCILWNEAHGFAKPGRLDWTDGAGVLHRVHGRQP
jgi:hypothetical protein